MINDRIALSVPSSMGMMGSVRTQTTYWQAVTLLFCSSSQKSVEPGALADELSLLESVKYFVYVFLFNEGIAPQIQSQNS
jgi:hypothetical protein